MSLGAAFQRSRATQKFNCDDELQMQSVSINRAIGAGHGELQEEKIHGYDSVFKSWLDTEQIADGNSRRWIRLVAGHPEERRQTFVRKTRQGCRELTAERYLRCVPTSVSL